MDSATGVPNTYPLDSDYPVDSAIQRLNNHRAATQSVRVADCYFIVRDGPLEKLWGGGEGNFRAAGGRFFRYQIPCMIFFRP